MKVLRSKEACWENLKQSSFRSLGFVPTMGALHEGHLSLIKVAKSSCEKVVVSIFVNPKQFGANEDFTQYPRNEADDLAKCEAAGVDYVYMPSQDEFYPKNFSSFAEEIKIGKRLCGEFRPNHFRGVCTVLLKLLIQTNPSHMFMGLKDAQQVRVVQKFVEDFDMPTQVIPCPTIREEDGMALSSRNRYLSPFEREKAKLISQALLEAKDMFLQGEIRSQALIGAAKQVIMSHTLPRLQYLEVVRWRDFDICSTVEEKSLLATATYIGNTRLIDNVFLDP